MRGNKRLKSLPSSLTTPLTYRSKFSRLSSEISTTLFPKAIAPSGGQTSNLLLGTIDKLTSYKLDVRGTTLLSGAVTIADNYTLPTAAPGSNNYVLVGDTDGTVAWEAQSGGGGGGTPGGADQNIQYNNGGSFGGIAAFGFDDTDIVLGATTKLYFDGSGGPPIAAGDTYLVESSADVLDIYVGAANMMKFTEAGTDVIDITANTNITGATTMSSTLGTAGLITASGGLTMHTSQDFTMGTIATNDILISTDSVGTVDTALVTAKYVGTFYAPVAITGTVTTANSPVANDFARFTDADTIEGRSYSETRSDLGLGSAALRAAEDTLTDGSNLPDGAAIKSYGDTNWANEIDISGTPSAGQYAKWTDADTVEGATLGSAILRDAEDTLTDGSNLPDGAAIKAYGDSNWSGTGPWTSGSGFIYPTVTTDDLVIGASAQTAATVVVDVQGTGTAKSNFDIMALTNKVNAADMDLTVTSILFNQYYYDASTPAIENLGRIGFSANNDWTSTASTRDSTFYIATVKDGNINSAAPGQFSVNELGDANVQHSLDMGGLGAEGIGTTLTIGSPTANEPTIVMTNGADDATAPIIELYNKRSHLAITGPSDNDSGGVIKFYTDNDADAKTEAARISAKMANVNDGVERGYMALSVAEYDGTMTEGFVMSGGSSDGVINTNFPTAGTLGISGNTTIEGTSLLSGNTTVTGTLTTTGIATLADASTLASDAAPTADAEIANKKYVDDNAGGGGTVTTANSPVANDFARFTDSTTIEGRDYTQTKSDLSLGNVENTALSTWAGTTNITTLGTITAGTWTGTEIGLGYGGTELVGETDGKIVVADGAGAPTHLDIGSSTGITILGTIATGVWNGTAIDLSLIHI